MDPMQSLATASAVLKPRRLGHVNLFVSDLERSMAFYENVAGFHEIFREPDIQAGFLSNGNTHHDFGLIQTPDVDRVDKNGKVLIAASQRGRTAGLNASARLAPSGVT